MLCTYFNRKKNKKQNLIFRFEKNSYFYYIRYSNFQKKSLLSCLLSCCSIFVYSTSTFSHQSHFFLIWFISNLIHKQQMHLYEFNFYFSALCIQHEEKWYYTLYVWVIFFLIHFTQHPLIMFVIRLNCVNTVYQWEKIVLFFHSLRYVCETWWTCDMIDSISKGVVELCFNISDYLPMCYKWLALKCIHNQYDRWKSKTQKFFTHFYFLLEKLYVGEQLIENCSNL